MAILNRIRILSGNILKIIALVTMTVDHIGGLIFPHLTWVRIVGRLAFPIFAYMIAEGCLYTRSRKKYLTLVLFFGIICQCIYWFSQHSLYQCILITFALSIILIYMLDTAWKRGSYWWILFIIVLAAEFVLTWVIPQMSWSGGFEVDYGFFGVLLPVLVYLPNLFFTDEAQKDDIKFILKWILLAAGLAGVAATVTLRVQWWSFLALIPILMYSGRRGRLKLKYLFYFYYPAHLGIIYLISTLIK